MGGLNHGSVMKIMPPLSWILSFPTNHIFIDNRPLPPKIVMGISQITFTERLRRQPESQTDECSIHGWPKPGSVMKMMPPLPWILSFPTNHIFINNRPLPSKIVVGISQIAFTERLRRQPEPQTDVSLIHGWPKPWIRHENDASPSMNFIVSN